MIIFTVDARFVRAAQHACAGPKDKRNYLHGIHFRTGGIIEATSGAVLYQGQWDKYCALKANLILQIDGKIPASADTITFNIEDDKSSGVCRTETGKLYSVKVIDGTFPNVDKAIPGNRSAYSNGLGVDPASLIKIGQIAGKTDKATSLVMTLGLENEPALFTFGHAIKLPDDPYLTTFKAVLSFCLVKTDNFMQSVNVGKFAA